MADVIVIGAGLGGLSTAMLLAQDGHAVTVLDRDLAPPPDDAAEAWRAWERRGVAQFRMAHFLLARWRDIAERELPALVRCLEDLGGLRWNLVSALPDELTGAQRPGDDRYESLTGRRPVIEAAAARAAEGTDGVTVRRGQAVAGLLTAEPAGGAAGPPHVIGVRTGSGDELRADLVIDSTGRRSPLGRWLADIGARPPLDEAEDCGFRYFQRHFRSSDGIPDALAPPLHPYDSVSLLTLPGDNGAWAVVFVTSSADRDVMGLRDPDRWDAALARYPLAAHWASGEPLGGVDVMTKLEDRYRRLVVDGEPVATGIVGVADSIACTNPSLGRGATMALMHACSLRDLLRDVAPSDAHELALRWDKVTDATIGNLYRATLAYDRARLAEVEAQRDGSAYDPSDPSWPITKAFAAAARVDGDILRAFLEVMYLYQTPEEALAAPGLFERILELGGAGDPPPLPGPDRAELLAVLAG